MPRARTKAVTVKIFFTLPFYTRRNELSIAELESGYGIAYNHLMNLYESPCGYFDENTSKAEIYSFPTEEELNEIFPQKTTMPKQESFYEFQLEQGFRRTGELIYRETCPHCKKCIPIRIPAKKYQANKTARHLLRKNSDLELLIREAPDDFITEEKILLYQNYWRRHNPGKTISREDAFSDLVAFSGCGDKNKSYSGTKNFDYYLDGKLVAVSVLDFALASISSNYFYYDISPQILKRSPGTFSIINEILWAKEHDYDYYYLGYWIKGHPKMNYKANFFPHELCINDIWEEVKAAEINGL